MINQAIVEGRLTRDPELQKTSSGKSVTQIRVAVDRPFSRDKADFIPVVLWEKKAEFVCQYFHKGDGIYIIGLNQTRSYKNKNNEDVFVMEVVADQVGFPVSSPKSGNTVSSNSSSQGVETDTPQSKKNIQKGSNPDIKKNDPFQGTGDININDSDLPF